jgi:hypothetical protein
VLSKWADMEQESSRDIGILPNSCSHNERDGRKVASVSAEASPSPMCYYRAMTIAVDMAAQRRWSAIQPAPTCSLR